MGKKEVVTNRSCPNKGLQRTRLGFPYDDVSLLTFSVCDLSEYTCGFADDTS